MQKEFNLIKSREVAGVKAYIHSENSDGTLNVCFNLSTYAPKPCHLHRYQKDYLEQYYQSDGTTKWRIDQMLKYILLLLLSAGLNAAEYSGRVVGVTDGDTIKVLENGKTLHKIRLYGIDAPERSQAFGSASKQALSHLIFGKDVRIEVVNIDRYGREVGIVLYQGDSWSANIRMISDGYAWAYTNYLRKKDRLLYIDTEWAAKSEQRGLWADKDPTPPWNYRRAKKRKK